MSLPPTMYALVDGNNFYARCEIIFDPRLRGHPLCVLSNNDGCVVARSPEAKAVGIRMGVPVFQIRDLVEREGVILRSSNYALYADMSRRFMEVLEALAPEVEVYSIDEAFLELSGLERTEGLEAFGNRVRKTVRRWTGIQTCVGIGPSKTLAKLANHTAKKDPAAGGVVDLSREDTRRWVLSRIQVEDVWGIGSRIARRLARYGIRTAADLAAADPKALRREMSVNVERTVRELQGTSCIRLEPIAPAKQEIVCSRSFGERVTALPELQEAVADYAARAAEKLRQEGRLTGSVAVFIRTGFFNAAEPHYGNQAQRALVLPSQDSREIVTVAVSLLETIWRPGFRYAKAGVMLSDICEPRQEQGDLFATPTAPARSAKLMETIDKLNAHDRGTVFLARQGTRKRWTMRRGRLSPSYTTRWSDIPVAR